MTGREDLARVIGVSLFNDEQTPLSTGSRALNATDAVLAHIADVLHDDATVEALARGAYNAFGRRETGRKWEALPMRSDGLRSYYLGIADGLIDILAERLGVPHVDR